MKKIIILTICSFWALSAIAQNIQGAWGGMLNVGGSKLTIIIHIDKKEGAYSATMDSPNQGAKGIPVNTITFENEQLSFAITNLGAKYEGMLQGDSIVGTFRQSGMAFPLVLSRTDANSASKTKPQEPKPPYPYNSEEVRFENKSANITLAGTFTWPKEGKDFPVVVLVTGSGPQNRNEELLGHKPFLVLSDYLTRNGIAVLRYDDRGVAESSGDYKTASLNDFTTDAAAAINYLKNKKEINRKKIGIIGHSEGGTIAFFLASAKKNDLAFIVSMAGMAIPGDSLLRIQRYMIGKSEGISDERIAENESFLTMINTLVNKYPEDYISQNMNRLIDEMLPDSLKGYPEVKAVFQQGIKQMMQAEIQSIIACNPTHALKKIKCPVLALNGEKDLQVEADINLSQVKTLVKAPVTTKKYSDLNHLFQHCTTGLIHEYAEIEETIAPEVLDDICTWIKQIVK